MSSESFAKPQFILAEAAEDVQRHHLQAGSQQGVPGPRQPLCGQAESAPLLLGTCTQNTVIIKHRQTLE